MKKVLLYGFGSSPIFINPFIKETKKRNILFKYSLILDNSHYLDMMSTVINNVLCIKRELPNNISQDIDLNELKNYPSNLFKDIESEKRTLKNKNSEEQLKIAFATYKLIKLFILKIKPDYILYIQHPENMTGVMISNIALELNIPISVPISTRNIDTSFFSNSYQEILPKYGKINDTDTLKAENFFTSYRDKHISSSIKNKDIFITPINFIQPSFYARLKKYILRYFVETENREFSTFYIAFVNNLPFYRNFIWFMRKTINKTMYNIDSFTKLPNKFIYYPLQYTPESSINIPAPYYIDQLRIIDSIRMSMPNDMMLIVKEHPDCIEVRPRYFVKNLLKKAGVVVAKYDMDSREIIKQADITISVSGTASFEAFLLGKQSIIMSPTFFDSFIGGVCKSNDLKETIVNKLNIKINDEEIINALARIYSVSSKFYGITAIGNGGVMMTKENVNNFIDAVLIHINSKENKYNEK